MLTSATTGPGASSTGARSAEKVNSPANRCSRDFENSQKRNSRRAAGMLMCSRDSLKSKCSHLQHLDLELAARSAEKLPDPEFTVCGTSKTAKRRTTKELLGICCGFSKRQVLTSAKPGSGARSAENHSSYGNHCPQEIEYNQKKNLQRADGMLLYSQI